MAMQVTARGMPTQPRANGMQIGTFQAGLTFYLQAQAASSNSCQEKGVGKAQMEDGLLAWNASFKPSVLPG